MGRKGFIVSLIVFLISAAWFSVYGVPLAQPGSFIAGLLTLVSSWASFIALACTFAFGLSWVVEKYRPGSDAGLWALGSFAIFLLLVGAYPPSILGFTNGGNTLGFFLGIFAMIGFMMSEPWEGWEVRGKALYLAAVLAGVSQAYWYDPIPIPIWYFPLPLPVSGVFYGNLAYIALAAIAFPDPRDSVHDLTRSIRALLVFVMISVVTKWILVFVGFPGAPGGILSPYSGGLGYVMQLIEGDVIFFVILAFIGWGIRYGEKTITYGQTQHGEEY